MSKVEEVARALAATRYINIGGADSTALGKPAWVYCVPDAMTAIEAMRKPTDAMVAAAKKACGVEEIFAFFKKLEEAGKAEIKMMKWTGDIEYAAMIDAALNEEG